MRDQIALGLIDKAFRIGVLSLQIFGSSELAAQAALTSAENPVLFVGAQDKVLEFGPAQGFCC